MKWSSLSDEVCPVARALSVVGDRWTLLILRDCFLGLSRFEQFVDSTGVTRHILSDRLKKLVEIDVLAREPYSSSQHRFAYTLTEKGRALAPVLTSLRDWGKHNMPLRRQTGNKL